MFGNSSVFNSSVATDNNSIKLWDCVLYPNQVKSGIGKVGEKYLLTSDRTTELDNIVLPIKEGSIIYFDFNSSEWKVQDKSYRDKISSLENRTTAIEEQIGNINYLGEWNAETNSPELTSSSGSVGDVYDIINTGTYDLGFGEKTYIYPNRIKRFEEGWDQLPIAAEIQDNEISLNKTFSSQKIVNDFLQKDDNLNSVIDKVQARTNLDVYSKDEIDAKNKNKIILKTASSEIKYYENNVCFICSENLECTFLIPDSDYNGLSWEILNLQSSTNTLTIILPSGKTFYHDGSSSIIINQGQSLSLFLIDNYFFIKV